ncbi:hypothetical protein PARPLA_00843 [Rhodobacteraceae bacterium THAF1]|uniref:Hint domain-containing protein n=1 Tax=Palleronia sp. THAF1 TaxID=2587842 RepID=UPI000F3D71B8|nr:Hint domain-containing protein [Palleronia sp. THAF1]QFU09598.1 hypothetical protein FIU81_13040 [Palleronia sp. THAF1]VDC17501.1 hypothetical protein PARPLA_00843 [Rhodobacteraceae bacterium THAF1]
MAGSPGTYVLAWSQTEIDGLSSAPPAAMQIGAAWSWSGEAQRIDGSSSILMLLDPIGGRDLRRRASRAAFKILRRAQVPVADMDELDFEPSAIETQFSLTDGIRVFPAALVSTELTARPLIVFPEALPPAGAQLYVLTAPEPSRRARPAAPPSVICFTTGTRLDTPTGPIAVEHLRPGDTLRTKDAGDQPILWTGSREYSGARLHALPHLRPVRIPNAAFGAGDPRGDLLVSPDHRLLIQGAAAHALFNTPEVLVTAADLVGRCGIGVDRSARDVTYHHILLPRHEIVWANGMATESFHPDYADLSDMPDAARTALQAAIPDPGHVVDGYGPPARRMLKSAEAEIMFHDGAGRQALRQFA